MQNNHSSMDNFTREVSRARQGKVVEENLQGASALRERVKLQRRSLSPEVARRKAYSEILTATCNHPVTETMFLEQDGVMCHASYFDSPWVRLGGYARWVWDKGISSGVLRCLSFRGCPRPQDTARTRGFCHLHIKCYSCHKVEGGWIRSPSGLA